MLRVELRELARDELGFAAGVAARGLRDNPLMTAVLGTDPRHRERELAKTWSAYLPVMAHPPLSAWRDDYVVGLVAAAPPGSCLMSFWQLLRMLPRSRPTRVGDMRRTMQSLSVLERHDPAEPHWHVGPVAVEGGMRGMGVGSQLMEAFAERMDERRETAYLETDKPENVTFYERFGFDVTDEIEVLGAPVWLMLRVSPRAAQSLSR